VGRIIIEGNTVTQDRVILNELGLRPGQILQYPMLKQAEMNLLRRGIFDAENPPTVEVIPNESDGVYKDIRVRVNETRTGQFRIGTGANLSSEVTGSITQNEKNILTNPSGSPLNHLSANQFQDWVVGQRSSVPANGTKPAGPGPDQARAIEAQIYELQKKLADLRAANKKEVVLTGKDLGPDTDLGRVMTALASLADVRYGAEERKRRLSFSVGKVGEKHETEGLTIGGDAEAVDWMVGIAEKLKAGGNKPKTPQPGGR